MTATELKKRIHAVPFEPFNVVLADGKKLPVPHPDFIHVVPSGRLAQVWDEDDDWTIVDIFLVTALEKSRARARRQKQRR